MSLSHFKFDYAVLVLPLLILDILFRTFGFIAPKTCNYLAFQSFGFVRTSGMNVIPETRLAH
jgi:hypothetical protein